MRFIQKFPPMPMAGYKWKFPLFRSVKLENGLRVIWEWVQFREVLGPDSTVYREYRDHIARILGKTKPRLR